MGPERLRSGVLATVVRQTLCSGLVALVAMFFSAPRSWSGEEPVLTPHVFSGVIYLTRGTLHSYELSQYFSHEDSCRYLETYFKWPHEYCSDIENIILDSRGTHYLIIVYKPTNVGRLDLTDWSGAAADFTTIWQHLEGALDSWSMDLGYHVVPVRWFMVPELSLDPPRLAFAILYDSAGARFIEANLAIFDRYGYVRFRVVLPDQRRGWAEMKGLVLQLALNYQSSDGASLEDASFWDRRAGIRPIELVDQFVGADHQMTLLQTTLDVLRKSTRFGQILLFWTGTF